MYALLNLKNMSEFQDLSYERKHEETLEAENIVHGSDDYIIHRQKGQQYP